VKLVSSGKNNKLNRTRNNTGPINGNTQINRTVSPVNNIPISGRNMPPVSRNIPPVNGKSPVIHKKPPKKLSPVKTVIIILLIVITGAAALFVSLGLYVDSLDIFFPNVWVEGVEVSGLTQEEATQKLINSGYETNADGISVTINFPDNTGFTFTGAEVGLSLNAAEAVKNAFPFGRTETFIGNLLTYVNSVFERTDLTDLSTPVFEDVIIRNLSDEYTGMFNDTLISGSLEENENYITIVKGTGLHLVNADNIYDLAIKTLRQAVEGHSHISANYVPDRDDINNTDSQIIELERLFERIHTDAESVEYEIDIDAEDFINILSESSEGRTFDLADAKERLSTAQYGEIIVIDFETLYPEVTADDIRGKIFRDVLAERRTVIGGTSNRISNVVLAAKYINEFQGGSGFILMPGEVFSFNDTVGRRGAERGFLQAPGFRAGQLEDMYGGGVCQTASTIYSAVLLTYLEVVERSQHGMRVTYLPEGEDAAISYGTIDLKFRNNTGFPIRMEVVGSIANKSLTVRLIGTKSDDADDGTFFKIVQRDRVEIEMTKQTMESDVDGRGNPLYVGQTWRNTGFMGVRVETWREYHDISFYPNGNVDSDGKDLRDPNNPDDAALISRDKRISRDNFRMVPEVTRIGTRVPDSIPDTGGGGFGGGETGGGGGGETGGGGGGATGGDTGGDTGDDSVPEN